MELYFFVKNAEGNVSRHSNVDGDGKVVECTVPPELVDEVAKLSEAGYVPATAEEWDQQIIKGATAGMVPAEAGDESTEQEKSNEDVSTDV